MVGLASNVVRSVSVKNTQNALMQLPQGCFLR